MSLAFLTTFLRRPTEIGSVWPSSRFLVERILDEACLRPGERVVELGAGTGPVTRALAGHDGPVLALEPDPGLCPLARAAAPGVEVVQDTAEHLPDLLEARDWPHADVVISGLPFASWPGPRQDAVLDAILAVMPIHGRFLTFTYVHSMMLPPAHRLQRVLRDRIGPLRISAPVWACVPPARVYTVEVREAGVRCRTPG